MGWAEEKEKEDMFNKHCKKVALIMALSMMTSVTAFAEKKIFNFNVVVERTSKYSGENPKSDNEGYAYVTVEKANVKNDSAVEYAVSNTGRTADVSTVFEFDGKIKPYKDRLKYKSGYAKKGKKYRLRIKSLNHNLQISGRWNS